jgi:hypothetical protein
MDGYDQNTVSSLHITQSLLFPYNLVLANLLI